MLSHVLFFVMGLAALVAMVIRDQKKRDVEPGARED
jgi:hypothetical protein